jgi:hypothetical protein
VLIVKKVWMIAMIVILLCGCFVFGFIAGVKPHADEQAKITAGNSNDVITDEKRIEFDVCPITEEEVEMLAKVMQNEAQVVKWNGDKWGVSYKARQAAVAWCVLNRYDSGFGSTLAAIISRPAQFAYDADMQVSDEMMCLAADVVARWWQEKSGVENVGRTLPADYLYFEGNGRENFFCKTFNGDEVWDWTLPDPYTE